MTDPDQLIDELVDAMFRDSDRERLRQIEGEIVDLPPDDIGPCDHVRPLDDSDLPF